jgi:hypothetical protein
MSKKPKRDWPERVIAMKSKVGLTLLAVAFLFTTIVSPQGQSAPPQATVQQETETDEIIRELRAIRQRVDMSAIWVMVSLLATIDGQSRVSDIVVTSEPVVVSLSTGRPAVEFAIVNTGNQAVTAWSVDVTVRLSDGTVRNTGAGADAYLKYAGIGAGKIRSSVPSYGTIRGTAAIIEPLGDLVVVSVRSTLRWAIFADGSWVGHSEDVQRVFQRREREMHAMGVIVAALRAGRAKGSGSEALRSALEYLNSREQDDYDQGDKITMRRNLQMAIEEKLKISPEEFFAYWIPRCEAKWTAAELHRRSKSDGPK